MQKVEHNPDILCRSSQEDKHLIAIVEKADVADPSSTWTGTTGSNFSQVAQALDAGRTAKQCRDRWVNHLRGGIKKGSWTADEEDLIRHMYQTFGPK